MVSAKLAVRIGLIIGVSLCGCATATQSTYRPPQEVKITNEKTVNAPFDDVWSRALPKLAQSFFSINNMEKDSGFLNLSYAGDPGTYVDCGTNVMTGKGQTQAVSLSNSTNSVDATVKGGSQVTVNAQTTLDTKINVVFVKETETTTRVSVNVQYEVRKINVAMLKSVGLGLAVAQALAASGGSYVRGPQPGDVVSRTEGRAVFKSGQTVPISNFENMLCRATGQMEHDILSLIE